MSLLARPLLTSRTTSRSCRGGTSSMNAWSREPAAPSGRTLRIAASAAAKPKLPLLHERPRRFRVVFCQACMDVVCDLEVHAFLEVAVDRAVEVLLHVAVGDRRTLGPPPGPVPQLF